MFLKKCFFIPFISGIILILGNYASITSNDTATPSHEKIAIVFDMDGVFITTDEQKSRQQIGTKLFIQYAGSNLSKLFNIKKMVHHLLFDFLYSLKPGTSEACDAQGNPLPLIMVDWLAGRTTGEAILQQINTKLDTYDDEYTETERELLTNITRMMFTPEIFIETRQFFDEAVEMAREYKEAGYSVYGLTNWDAESFDVLMELHPDIMDVFDDVIVSGKVKLIKPDTAIFRHFLKKHGLYARSCIFVDDRPENVKAAQAVGIHGILCAPRNGILKKGPDFESVQDQINEQIIAIQGRTVTTT